MSKRTTGIYKRKDGRWEARYKWGTDSQGRTVYRSVYGSSYQEARSKRDEQIPLGYIQTTDITFAEVYSMWLARKRLTLKEQTCIKYDYCARSHILPVLGNIKLSRLTSSEIDGFIARKAESGRLDGEGGLSASYLRLIVVIIGSVIEYARDEGYMLSVKGKTVKPRCEKREIALFSPEEQKQLESKLQSDLRHTSLAVWLSLYTGMRIGEICALKWSDIDWQYRLIRVDKTVVRINTDKGMELKIDKPKTYSSHRIIPLSASLFGILQKAQCNSGSEYVIASPKDKGFVNPRTLEARYKAMLREWQIRQINFHGLRHTFATRCIECGMDIKTLSEMLGHSSVSITLDIYVHPDLEHKRKEMDKLQAVL